MQKLAYLLRPYVYLYIIMLQCFMEPLKKVQVEGFLMFAEPQDLFGNLDELCYVSSHCRPTIYLTYYNSLYSKNDVCH